MADYKLEPDVKEVLLRSSCNANALYLPPGQLDRELYSRVDKALGKAGGKWNRSAKAHLFPGDAASKLAAMLNTGIAVDEKKRDQAFFSPPEVALAVVRLADVRNRTVLEPEAGPGALVQACKIAGASQVTVVEINPQHADELARQCNVVHIVDFLKCEPHCLPTLGLFERVVMNPPFTKNQDVVHVRHALKFLVPGGVLVSVMFGNQDRPQFQRLKKDYQPRIVELPRGAFKESGTDIATVLVRIEK